MALATVNLFGAGQGNRRGVITFSTSDAAAAEPAERMRLDAGGNVGIGTSTPAAKLDVNGAVAIAGKTALGTQQAWLVLNETLAFASGVHTPGKSDERFKENIHDVEAALDKVSRLRGVSFQWKDAAPEESHRIGMIAQEVRDVLPAAVSQDGRGYLGLDYNAITSLLVQAVKEQQQLIQALTDTVGALRQQLDGSAR
jgi:hypothetical protein